MSKAPDAETPKENDSATNALLQQAEGWLQLWQQAQGLMLEAAEKQLKEPDLAMTTPQSIWQTYWEWAQQWLQKPDALWQEQWQFWQDYLRLWQRAAEKMQGQEPTVPAPHLPPADKRFSNPAFEQDATFEFIKQSYLLAADWLNRLSHKGDGLDEATQRRMQFYTRQFIDALSPTNFVLTNPEVLQTTLATGGENLRRGFSNLLQDIARGKGELRIAMTDEKAFTLGQNVAITPGAVVYQNELMQLIQYTPTTATTAEKPLLIIPPWINKYYILDLQPKNSFIKYAVDQGQTVFVVSWVNPDASLRDKNFADYLQHGILDALAAIKKQTGAPQVNAIGYCLGGTLLASALAYLAAKKQTPIASATFFTTLVNFAQPGELGVFIDDEHLQAMEARMAQQGYLDGQAMATTFNLLRANDLIWSFVVNNYLLGQSPFPFDLLYWNNDTTRMPAAMHSFYLRQMYQHNKLCQKNGINLLGQDIDLSLIKTPCYILACKDDHIAPWRSVYAATQLYQGPCEFVLSGSGHIAGVINPANSIKYGYQTNHATPATADEWLQSAQTHQGSWWPHWLNWLKAHHGAEVPARNISNALEPAPGSYVKVKA